MTTPLTILYTANIRGDLDLLPRLYTFLRQLRQQAQRYEDDEDVKVCDLQPPARRVLTIDLGQSCAPEVWHCVVTNGRSVLVVLDAMGYDAAGVAGQLGPEARDKLLETAQMALVDEAHAYAKEGVAVVAPGYIGDFETTPVVKLLLAPEARPRLEGGVLIPMRVAAGQVGVAHVAFRTGVPRLSGHDLFELSPSVRPDPTIAGTVDFVLSEARYYQKKQT